MLEHVRAYVTICLDIHGREKSKTYRASVGKCDGCPCTAVNGDRVNVTVQGHDEREEGKSSKLADREGARTRGREDARTRGSEGARVQEEER